MFGQTLCEILRHVHPVSVADDRESCQVVIGVEKVLAVVGRVHEALVYFSGARCKTHVFSLGAKPLAAGRRQALWQRGLSGQIVRKLILGSHERRVLPCSPHQSFLARERRKTGFGPGLIRQIEELALSLLIVWSRHGVRRSWNGGPWIRRLLQCGPGTRQAKAQQADEKWTTHTVSLPPKMEPQKSHFVSLKRANG